jgi:hypothetical protein
MGSEEELFLYVSVIAAHSHRAWLKFFAPAEQDVYRPVL